MSLKLRHLVLPGVLIAACEVPLVVQSSAPIAEGGEGGVGGLSGAGGDEGGEAGAPSKAGTNGSAGSGQPMAGAGGAATAGSAGSGGSAGSAGGTSDKITPCQPPTHELYAQSISAGESHACAIESATGYLYCWGNGSSGQLGNGDTEKSNVPVLSRPERA
jgi:hypothetical protein